MIFDQRRHPRTGGGFTLIELVAVMVIAAILAAAASPMLTDMDSNRAMIAATELERGLSFARQRAVATGTRTWVVFDASAETWTVRTEDPDNPGRANATTMTDPSTGATFTVTLDTGTAAGVQIVSAAFDADDEVAFDWLGRPYNESETALAAQGVITLTGSHQITVEAGTGHIRYTPP